MKPVTTAFTILGILIFVVVGLIWYANLHDGYCDVYFNATANGTVAQDYADIFKKSFETGIYRISNSEDDCDVRIYLILGDMSAPGTEKRLIMSMGAIMVLDDSGNVLHYSLCGTTAYANPRNDDERLYNASMLVQAITQKYEQIVPCMRYR